MGGIIYDARRVKAYEGLLTLGDIASLDEQWCQKLWDDMLEYPDMVDELMFYLDHHYITEKVTCEGYSLIDLYVWQLNMYNIIGDVGKNTDSCNKERMVLHAFRDMVNMRKDPEAFIKKMTDGRGMDK